MTLAMSQVGQLGGFLQVGPHYYPDRRANGVQIIMRGPHGQRLAADPVYLRRHNQPRGSGFRFWVEELNVPANVEWNPQQVVTGFMGMGLGARPLGGYLARTQKVIVQNGATPAAVCALDNTNSALFQKIANDAFPDEADLDNGTGELRAVVDRISGEGALAQSAQAMACLIRWQAGVFGGSQARRRIADVNALHVLLVARRGSVREDGAPMINPTAYDPKTGRVRPFTQAEYCRQNPQACFPETQCEWYDVACLGGEWWDRNWWKIALGVGGVVALYSFGRGAGSGAASVLAEARK